jgi:translation initiation factor IF-3
MAQEDFIKLIQDQTKVAKSKVKNIGTQPAKQIELNWAIAEGDLKHRLDAMQVFLEKGRRVEVLLAPKRKGRRATQQEATDILEKVRRRIRDLEGAKEWKSMSGEVMATATLYFEMKGAKPSTEEEDDE